MIQPSDRVYQLKITLVGVQPPVWRRFLVADSISLDDLHDVIQIVMGWTDTHLYGFVSGDTNYGPIDPDFDDPFMETVDSAGVELNRVMCNEGDKILYEYDFGDGWEHDLLLEKILPGKGDQQLPYCVEGSRGCPPEDVGGIFGYADFLKIYHDKKHPEHDEMMEWSGEYFDPEHFDVVEINEILHEPLE